MTDRERWIIYPLLFLALGAALKDKLVPPSQLIAGEVIANRIRIVDSKSNTKIDLNVKETSHQANPKSFVSEGRLNIFGHTNKIPIASLGRDLFVPSLRTSSVGIIDPTGKQRATLNTQMFVSDPEKKTADWAGSLVLSGPNNAPMVSIGTATDGKSGALNTFSSEGRGLITLGSKEDGGAIIAHHRTRDLTIAVGHFPSLSGAFFVYQGKVFARPHFVLSPKEIQSIPELPPLRPSPQDMMKSFEKKEALSPKGDVESKPAEDQASKESKLESKPEKEDAPKKE